MSDKEKVSGEEVEVVAYANPLAFRNFKEHSHKGGVHAREWMWAFPGADLVPVMTVAQHQRITEALRGEVERLRAVYLDQHDKRVAIEIERNDLRTEVERLNRSLQHMIDQTTPLEPVPGDPKWSRRIQLDEVIAERDALRAQLAQQQGVPDALPHWEPCNPGCDPEFNGSRSRHCATLCHNAREALAAAPAPARCEYCDDTGDVHGLDGEWKGSCVCPAGRAPVQAEAASPWVAVTERLPEIDMTAPAYARKMAVIAWNPRWSEPRELVYSSNGYAKTEKGQAPRWEETRGCLAFGVPTHWMPKPLPPAPEVV